MINYEKLSKKLDEALARETSESLNQWLASEELEERGYIGGGTLTPIGKISQTSFFKRSISSSDRISEALLIAEPWSWSKAA